MFQKIINANEEFQEYMDEIYQFLKKIPKGNS